MSRGTGLQRGPGLPGGGGRGPLRVRLVLPRLSARRTELCNALAASPGIDLGVVHLCRRQRRPEDIRLDAVRYSFSIISHRGLRDERLTWGGDLIRRLSREPIDVVVVGGCEHPAYVQAILYARARGLRSALWAEGAAADRRPAGDPRRWLQRKLVGLCDGFLAGGPADRDHLASLGADPERIHSVPPAAARPGSGRGGAGDPERRRRGRSRRGPASPVALHVGRLGRREGVLDLVAATRGLPGGAEMVIVGDGPLGDVLRRRVKTRGWKGVSLPGAVSRVRLERWYASADVFVLPGHAGARSGPGVLEAMAAGLPVVATEAAARETGLVRPDENGLVVPAGDPEALAAAVGRVMGDPALAIRMGAASRRIVAARTPERSARAMADALRAIHEGSTP